MSGRGVKYSHFGSSIIRVRYAETLDEALKIISREQRRHKSPHHHKREVKLPTLRFLNPLRDLDDEQALIDASRAQRGMVAAKSTKAI